MSFLRQTTQKSGRPSEGAKVALRALREAVAEKDAPVSEAVWAERAYALGITESEIGELMRASFRRARKALFASNQVKK